MKRDIPEFGWHDAEASCAHVYLWDKIHLAIRESCLSENDKHENIRIFDTGCGNGYIAGKLCNNGYKVAGCDASEKGITQARNAYPDIRFELMSVYDDMAEIFGGGDWDIVISSEVIEHLYSPREYVERISELLRSGGVIILTTPYHGWLKNIALAVSGKMDNHFTTLWDGGHIKFWSYKTLTTLLLEKGFVVERFYGAGRCPWLWKSMVLVARKIT